MASASNPSGVNEREPRRDEQPMRQFVGFRLGDEHYAIPITTIREIILMKPITRLPQVVEFVEGLINLRGTVIPLINLRKRFAMPPRAFDDETRTIVVTVHDKTIGCIVDEVSQVMRISGEQIQPVPISMAASAKNYIAGLAKLEDSLLIILDIEKLFSPGEFEHGMASDLTSRSVTPLERHSERGA